MSRWLWTAELWTPVNITNGGPLPTMRWPGSGVRENRRARRFQLAARKSRGASSRLQRATAGKPLARFEGVRSSVLNALVPPWRGGVRVVAPKTRIPDPVECLTDGLQEWLELLGPRGVTELPQRLRLDLADPLARHVEGATDLLERV